MDLGLKGKSAIVTGATRGIGRAIADLLADEGVNVAVCARKADEVAATVSALQAKGVKAFGQVVDIADGAALQGFVRAIPGPVGTLPDAAVLGRLLGAAQGAPAAYDAESVWKDLAASQPALAGLAAGKVPPEGVALDGAAWSHLPFPERKLLKFAARA